MNDEIEPAVLPAEMMPEGALMQDFAERLVEQASRDGVDLTGEGGLLTGFIRQVLQTGLEVEMADHLGYEPHAVEGRGSENSRRHCCKLPCQAASEVCWFRCCSSFHMRRMT
ncbi:MAG: hypothetical protein ACI91O_001807 [Candidatus Poriferisodalaceae bacterium]|jgi:hypothetical protein